MTILPPEGFDPTPVVFLISLSSICWTLLFQTQMALTAASRILDQVGRFEKQCDEKLKTMLAADRSPTEDTMLSYVLTTIFGFSLGVLCGLVDDWVKLLIVSTLNACAFFFFLPTTWRVWGYLILHDRLAYTSIRLGLLKAGYMDEILAERPAYMKRVLRKVDVSDWEVVEGNDEIATNTEASHREDEEYEDVVEDDMDDTDDSWSFDLDTPSETGTARSSGTFTLTRSTRTGGAKPGNSSVRETTDPPSKSIGARSHLDASILLPSAQVSREPHSRPQTRPDWFMPLTAESSEPKKATPQPRPSFQTSNPTFEHLLRDEIASSLRMLKSRVADQQQPTTTSHMVGKLEHQPADIIILRILQDTDSQEKMLVRIRKTTPFAQLKDRLRSKDEDACELMVKDSRNEFPVFDNETPSSVSPAPSHTVCRG